MKYFVQHRKMSTGSVKEWKMNQSRLRSKETNWKIMGKREMSHWTGHGSIAEKETDTCGLKGKTDLVMKTS